MAGCEKCCGSCGGCGELVLSPGEVGLLNLLAQIPFLPVARHAGSMEPVYLEDSTYTPQEYSTILQCLEKRGLISIDYDQPLKGRYDAAYAPYAVKGSFALTAKGQQVIELIDRQGLLEE